ncbi:hypothetical protein ACOMHN_005205 [Nucella lapillus]
MSDSQPPDGTGGSPAKTKYNEELPQEPHNPLLRKTKKTMKELPQEPHNPLLRKTKKTMKTRQEESPTVERGEDKEE